MKRQPKDCISKSYDPDTTRCDYRRIWLDLVSNEGGPAVHRLQIVCWMIALDLVFLVAVYQDLAMPDFSPLWSP